MQAIQRHDVHVQGDPRGTTIVLAHGLGCHQVVWRHLVPLLSAHRLVTFDHVGHGSVDPAAFVPARHAALDGYADDLVGVLEAAAPPGAALVGHSVSAMLAVLVAARRPDLVGALVLLAGAPRYLPDAGSGYDVGYTREQIDGVLAASDRDWTGWLQSVTPDILGDRDHPDVAAQLTFSTCRADPAILPAFTRATYLADVRDALPQVRAPALVLQGAHDPFAPVAAGEAFAARLPHAELEILPGAGHLPHLTAAPAVAAAIRGFLARVGR